MTDPDDGPGPMDWWDELEADAAASVREYEERGWEALQLHTADVTPLDGEFGDRVGLSVLVPDDEFERLQSLLADATVDGFEVYRTTVTGHVALLVVLEDETRDLAVVFPAYYSLGDDAAHRLFETALAEGELTVYLRNLAEESVEVTLSDPALLVPPEMAEADAPDGPPSLDDVGDE